MNILKRVWQWLTTKHQKESTVTDQVVEATADAAAPVVEPSAGESAPVTPAAEVKSGVQDFEAALSFVESGVAQLGAAAKDDLKGLAKKYL